MSDIKKQLTSGVLYTAIAKYAGIVISIVITGVLSRLLTAEDFGTIVPVSVLVSFFSILGDIGIGPAIIQNNELTKEDHSSIFSFTVIMAFILAVIFFSCSWLIASIYESDVFILLCQLLSCALFFSCINVVPNALLYKAKNFRFLAIRTSVVQLIAGTIAIISALLGIGLFALVIQSITSSIFMFILSYRENPLKLRFRTINWEPLKKIRSFSSFQFSFDILNYFSVNLDKLIINKYLGTSQLGYYDKSYRLMQMPLQNIPYIITPVMHPIFSSMQNDLEKMQVYYTKVIRLLAFIGFPLSILLFFAGKDIIFILFGTQWEPSVPVFKLLALSVGFQIILSTSGSIFQSAGSTRLLFLCGLLSTATIITAILTGIFAFQTLEAIGALLSCAYITNFFMAFAIMYCVLFKTGLIPFLKQIISPIILSIILAAILYGVSIITDDINVIISLIIKGSIAVCIAGVYLQFTNEYNLFRKVSDLISRFRSR